MRTVPCIARGATPSVTCSAPPCSPVGALRPSFIVVEAQKHRQHDEYRRRSGSRFVRGLRRGRRAFCQGGVSVVPQSLHSSRVHRARTRTPKGDAGRERPLLEALRQCLVKRGVEPFIRLRPHATAVIFLSHVTFLHVAPRVGVIDIAGRSRLASLSYPCFVLPVGSILMDARRRQRRTAPTAGAIKTANVGDDMGLAQNVIPNCAADAGFSGFPLPSDKLAYKDRGPRAFPTRHVVAA